MLPKDRDLNELFNWGPITLLSIYYKIFSRFLYIRISFHLFHRQFLDQNGFVQAIIIEDILLCEEVIIEHHQDSNLPLWILSMEMGKVFDISDLPILIRALHSRELPEAYVSLLYLFYANQMASVNGSSKFPIKREVKQDDTLSAILLNCVLDVKLDEWRRSLDQEDL